ncbi:MAG: GNAT family N-acetyltransferase, partial [Pseudonocardiaceae bacterium]
MARRDHLQFRFAGLVDAKAVAALHAGSWRRHYRGAYSDAFLDGDVIADRLTVWTDRLRDPDPSHRTFLAENDDGLVGFAHAVLDDDPTWGALIDNLHVIPEQQRRGIGSRLLALTAQTVIERADRPGLHLWVLEQNTEAQAFYQVCGGRCVGRRQISPPGGVPARLTGSPAALRYAWPDPLILRGRYRPGFAEFDRKAVSRQEDRPDVELGETRASVAGTGT